MKGDWVVKASGSRFFSYRTQKNVWNTPELTLFQERKNTIEEIKKKLQQISSKKHIRFVHLLCSYLWGSPKDYMAQWYYWWAAKYPVPAPDLCKFHMKGIHPIKQVLKAQLHYKLSEVSTRRSIQLYFY